MSNCDYACLALGLEISTHGATATISTTPQLYDSDYGYDYYSEACGPCAPFSATVNQEAATLTGTYPARTARPVSEVVVLLLKSCAW